MERPHIEKEISYKPPKAVQCPECQEEQSAKDLKLKAKFGFSNLRCQACQVVTTAACWRCQCGAKWIKCGIHRHGIEEKKVRRSKANNSSHEQANPERGVDRKMPVSRKKESVHEVAREGMQPSMHCERRIRLKPGSVLAARFPHLVRPPERE